MLTVRVPERDRNKCERVTGPKPERVRSIFAGVNATRTSGPGPERDRNANRNRCEHGHLGLTVDTNLNWKKHTEKVANRCSKKNGVLNRLKYVLPLCIKAMLYNTLILPHITYGIMVWGYRGNRH